MTSVRIAGDALFRFRRAMKLYLREPNSVHAIALVQAIGGAPMLTALHRLEMKAAIGQKLGCAEITASERDALLVDFENDIATGVFAETDPSWPGVFAHAEMLVATYTSMNFCRSLDTLRVALALELGATEFCTFDLRQAAMAIAAGLVVVP